VAESKSLPLPDDPVLAAWASRLNEVGHWAQLYDASWQLVFLTDELRSSYNDTGAASALPVGCHFFSAEMAAFRAAAIGGAHDNPEFRRARFSAGAGFVLANTPGGREELRRVVDPELADLVEALQPDDVPLARWVSAARFAGVDVVGGSTLMFAIDDGHGRPAGFCVLLKPAAGMSHLAAAAYIADLSHLDRMQVVEHADRRPAAILMADLEASSPLARRLSTAQYFTFGRRFVRAADQCIIDAGGIVGRHAGDGVAAFFLTETAGTESAAARACITAARTLRVALADVARRSELSEAEVALRFGLHWGATLYIGRILTAGRSEVTALGDEMNEAARIEACATGSRTLASKSLIERLAPADADPLGVDIHHMTYTPLAELATATDKARRDAPSVAVCEI
jgi:class 3 adenylate cyclase